MPGPMVVKASRKKEKPAVAPKRSAAKKPASKPAAKKAPAKKKEE